MLTGIGSSGSPAGLITSCIWKCPGCRAFCVKAVCTTLSFSPTSANIETATLEMDTPGKYYWFHLLTLEDGSCDYRTLNHLGCLYHPTPFQDDKECYIRILSEASILAWQTIIYKHLPVHLYWCQLSIAALTLWSTCCSRTEHVIMLISRNDRLHSAEFWRSSRFKRPDQVFLLVIWNPGYSSVIAFKRNSGFCFHM